MMGWEVGNCLSPSRVAALVLICFFIGCHKISGLEDNNVTDKDLKLDKNKSASSHKIEKPHSTSATKTVPLHKVFNGSYSIQYSPTSLARLSKTIDARPTRLPYIWVTKSQSQLSASTVASSFSRDKYHVPVRTSYHENQESGTSKKSSFIYTGSISSSTIIDTRPVISSFVTGTVFIENSNPSKLTVGQTSALSMYPEKLETVTPGSLVRSFSLFSTQAIRSTTGDKQSDSSAVRHVRSSKKIPGKSLATPSSTLTMSENRSVVSSSPHVSRSSTRQQIPILVDTKRILEASPSIPEFSSPVVTSSGTSMSPKPTRMLSSNISETVKEQTEESSSSILQKAFSIATSSMNPLVQTSVLSESPTIPSVHSTANTGNSTVKMSEIDKDVAASSAASQLKLLPTASLKNVSSISASYSAVFHGTSLVITKVASDLSTHPVATGSISYLSDSSLLQKDTVNATTSTTNAAEMTSHLEESSQNTSKFISKTTMIFPSSTFALMNGSRLLSNASQHTGKATKYLSTVNSTNTMITSTPDTLKTSTKPSSLTTVLFSVKSNLTSAYLTGIASVHPDSVSTTVTSITVNRTSISQRISPLVLPSSTVRPSSVFTSKKRNKTTAYPSSMVGSSIIVSSIQRKRTTFYPFTRTLKTPIDKPSTVSVSVKPNATIVHTRSETSKVVSQPQTKSTSATFPTSKPGTKSSTRKPSTTLPTSIPISTSSTTTSPTDNPTKYSTGKPSTKSSTGRPTMNPTTGSPKTKSPTGKPATTPKTTKTSAGPTTGKTMLSHPTRKQTTKTPFTTSKPPFIGVPKVTTKHLASFLSAIQVEFRVDFPGIKFATKLQILAQKLYASFDDSQTQIHTWYEVHYFKEYEYNPFIVKEYTDPKDTRQTLFNFTIGNDKRCKERRVSSGYCNGPLLVGKYRFRLVYHVGGTVKKSDFSGAYNTAPPRPTPAIHTTGIDQNKVTIAVIAVLAVLLVIIIIVAVVLYRKKNSRRDAASTSDDPECTLLSSLKRNSSSCYGRRVLGVGDSSLSLKHVSKALSRPVHLKDFVAWVTRSQADSDFRFAEEFESIRDVGRDQSHEASDLPENRGKNRYTNVLAHDKTRVKLSYTDDEAGSDYINANYIHGYKHPRAYIATQGPLPGTTDDFWRMIWEHDVYNIVMVTQCMERSRVKCHEYWPGTQPTAYGEITVSLLSEFSYPEWIEREFLLEGEGEGSRKVKHFQYTAWPDHGVPRTTSNILDFLQSIRSNVDPSHGPLVIHCSAGVGRTGTLIAIDTIINRLQEEDTVDVYLTVCLMRMQRCNMVQTEDQYIFIHRAVVHYLKNQDPVSQFKGYSLLPKDEGNSKSSFDHLAPSDSLTANRDSGLALLLGEFETEHAKEALETVA